MRRAQQVPIAILRRLRHSDDRQAERAEVYCSGGAYIRCDAIGDVAIALGPVTDSWWDLPPPPCPDCGAELVWGEAGRVPGARACTGCGSVFTVETETDRRS
jgi:hypothetical protein